MLGISHLVAGAAIGAAVPDRGTRTASVLASHVLLDFIGHDDHTVSPVTQGALAIGGIVVLASTWGARSAVVEAALVSALPDLEVLVDLALGRRFSHYLFPSHWQFRRTRGSHPYRLPGRPVHIRSEVAAALTVLAALAALGVDRRR